MRPGTQEINDGIDPAALRKLSNQVRDLLRFHLSMGVSVYPAKEKFRSLFIQKTPAPSAAISRASARTISKTPVPSLAAVRQQIAECSQCALAQNRLGQVSGRGAERPQLMVVGDWSHQQRASFSEDVLFGIDEDSMLRRMIQAIGLSADKIYVVNAVKCCPHDRQPDAACARLCFAHLSREIMALKPVLFLAMGEVATSSLIGASGPLVRLRGRFYPYRYPDGTPARVMPTFHPRFLLRNPEMKKIVWQDLQMIQRQLNK
jgi:DNA polymerase